MQCALFFRRKPMLKHTNFSTSLDLSAHREYSAKRLELIHPAPHCRSEALVLQLLYVQGSCFMLLGLSFQGLATRFSCAKSDSICLFQASRMSFTAPRIRACTRGSARTASRGPGASVLLNNCTNLAAIHLVCAGSPSMTVSMSRPEALSLPQDLGAAGSA